MNASRRTFTKSAVADWKVTVTTAAGSERTVLVYREQRGNASVRGGAYRDVWVAKFGGVKGVGETRDEAVDALEAAWQRRADERRAQA